ncbi:hypothetical protein AN639_01325 [Candidatus Epulonipiscium fishelsonii]|uniref:Uncharacterized protein n=1 Tax=Candidatus Epulonipiscium fishelsonii TaxID=77094 RepID=A0ACC8XC67_9FIRM|nr:hypothetical protein AN639_01325 [Epulopiscium sp. SCG-B05WGA-EpuloA1]ONI40030.1 hypothetical protein AN396_06680 [Epulopiscium sp. SCG-B11WGA-EpuloA1]
MKKTPTMKDIAEIVGVSVSTVSYVLNYSDKQKISNETRLKILTVAKELRYVPNISAKNLSKQLYMSNIGIIIDFSMLNNKNQLFEMYSTIELLRKELSEFNYNLIPIALKSIIDSPEVINNYGLNGVIFSDIRTTHINKIKKFTYVPIILLDCDIKNSDLFHKYHYNYSEIFKLIPSAFGKDFYIIYNQHSNNIYNRIVSNTISKNRYIDFNDIYTLDINKKYVVFGEFAYIRLLSIINSENLLPVIFSNSAFENTLYIKFDNENKIKELVMDLINIITLTFDKAAYYHIFDPVLITP